MCSRWQGLAKAKLNSSTEQSLLYRFKLSAQLNTSEFRVDVPVPLHSKPAAEEAQAGTSASLSHGVL